ncbi:fimbrial protein [Caballeronia sp. dw_19]|uniref:fimbrial protein n=1 Tax=Caballeronia sp. dw_19 TaxID=2719791 RepID=UPI001BD2B0BE|nr:fimbrial protein [Caballeronia sp. dw_19]
MCHTIRNIRYLMFVLAGLFSTKVFSAYSDCTAPLPAFVNLPSVSVPTNLAVGQDIPGAKASFSITITCTNKFNGTVHWYAQVSGLSAALVDGYSDVYMFPGITQGIGFRMRAIDGTVMKPISYSGTSNTFDFGVAQTGVSVLQGSFELVKTASAVAAGSFKFGAYVSAPSTEYANGGSGSNSLLSWGYTINPVTVAACSVVKSDIAVPLQNVHVSELPAPGSIAYPTNFGIDLRCESNARPQITLTDAATPLNQSTELTLAPGSTASGIAIQILYNDALVRLGPAPIFYTGSGAAITNSLDLGTVSGGIHLPFTARYIRTGNLTPGSVLGRATFTFTYQ